MALCKYCKSYLSCADCEEHQGTDCPDCEIDFSKALAVCENPPDVRAEVVSCTKYVIQREDGQFYYKGQASSSYGFTDDFSKAFLFATERGAEGRLRCSGNLKSEIRKVNITLV